MSNDNSTADAARIEEATQQPGDADKSVPSETATPKATDKEETPATPETPAEGKTAPPTEDKAARRRRIGKKILKWTGITFGVLFVLLILAVLFRDPIVKFAIRKIGTNLISPVDEIGKTVKDENGKPVKIKVDVKNFESSLSGWVRLTGFSVDNPMEYNQERKAVEFKEVYVKIKVGSLFTKKIEIEEVYVNGLHVYFQIAASGSNLTDILNNIKANTASSKKKKKKKEEQTKTQVVIRHLKVEDSSFDPNLLPSISLNMEKENIGDESAGGTSWEDFYGYLKSLVDVVWKAGGNISDSGARIVDKSKKFLFGK